MHIAYFDLIGKILCAGLIDLQPTQINIFELINLSFCDKLVELIYHAVMAKMIVRSYQHPMTSC